MGMWSYTKGQLQTMMGYTNGRRIRSSKNGMPHFMAMSIGRWEQGMWDVQINPSGSTYWKGAFLQISLVRTPIVCKSFRLVTWIRIHPYDNWSKPNSGFHIKKKLVAMDVPLPHFYRTPLKNGLHTWCLTYWCLAGNDNGGCWDDYW